MSQLVDLDWGNSIHHLTEVNANLVAPKVFADASILCISPDFVPSRQKGKKVRRVYQRSGNDLEQLTCFLRMAMVHTHRGRKRPRWFPGSSCAWARSW